MFWASVYRGPVFANALLMAFQQERQIGAHRFSFESPETLYGSLNGPLSLDEALQFVQLVREFGAKHGPLVVCIDVAQFKSSGARIRQAIIAEMTESYPVRAAVLVGAPFPIRIAMTMVAKAAKHINPRLFAFPIEFVANNEEAHAVMAVHRNRAESGEQLSTSMHQTAS